NRYELDALARGRAHLGYRGLWDNGADRAVHEQHRRLELTQQREEVLTMEVEPRLTHSVLVARRQPLGTHREVLIAERREVPLQLLDTGARARGCELCHEGLEWHRVLLTTGACERRVGEHKRACRSRVLDGGRCGNPCAHRVTDERGFLEAERCDH